MFHILQIFRSHHPNGNPHIADTGLKIGRYDLLPTSRQFVQIQQADRTDGSLRIFPGTLSGPDCSQHHNGRDNDAADQYDPFNNVVLFALHRSNILTERIVIMKACIR